MRDKNGNELLIGHEVIALGNRIGILQKISSDDDLAYIELIVGCERYWLASEQIEIRAEFGEEQIPIIPKIDGTKLNKINLPLIFDQQPSIQEKIDILFENFCEFLKEKNRRYGNSAMEPVRIFSKSDANNQIYNRLDDKLSRIKNSDDIKKNDLADVFGYVALALIKNNWLEFDELLD